MKMLSAAELLTIWERGQSEPQYQRALLLLAAVYPDKNMEHLARLSLGQRDTHLLMLKEKLFGSQIVGVVSCTNCDSSLELNLVVSDLLVSNSEQSSNLSLILDDYEIEFRLPNSLDLAKVSHLAGVSQIAEGLLQQCILAAKYQTQSISAAQLPDTIVRALTDQMERADPQANISLDYSCPDCQHQWIAAFDILTFLWQELTAWAYRILGEVHQLATAYNWHEADILAMTPQRRQIYLEMINS